MNGLSTALLSTSQGRRPRHPWLDATSRHRYCRGRVSLPAGDLSARSVNLTHSQNYRFRYGRPVPYILISHNRKRRAQGPPLHYYIYFSKKKTAHFRVRCVLALPIFPGRPSIVTPSGTVRWTVPGVKKEPDFRLTLYVGVTYLPGQSPAKYCRRKRA